MNDEQLLECLGILQEECAETIVVISKIRRFGLDTLYQDTQFTKREHLVQEVGDMLCLINMLIRNNILNEEQLKTATSLKLEKLKKFSNVGCL
jgi:hypothetical protein